MNNQVFDLAIDAVMKQVHVDRTKHIPYLAGYSIDGKTVYIDERMPLGFDFQGRWIATDKYIVLHEIIERLITWRYTAVPYQFAHQIALRLERDAVIADRIPWLVYNKFMMDWITKIGNASFTNVPQDLDHKPVKDSEDHKTAQKLRDLGHKV